MIRAVMGSMPAVNTVRASTRRPRYRGTGLLAKFELSTSQLMARCKRRGFLKSSDVREILGITQRQLTHLVKKGELSRCDDGKTGAERRFSFEDFETYVRKTYG